MNTFWLSTSAHLQFACVVFAFVSYLLIPKGERKAFQLVWLFLSASLLSEVSGFVGGFLLRKNMNLISNIQAMAVGPTLLLFYRQQISFEQYKSLASAAILSLFAFGIVDLIWIQGPMAPNSYVKICNSFCLITSGVIYFFSLARDLPTKTLSSFPMFWINTSILLGFSGAFMAHLATDYLLNSLQEKDYKTWIATWTVHNSIGALSYVGIGWAFILAKRGKH